MDTVKHILSRPPPPSGGADKTLLDCQALLAEASTFAKNLRNFEEAIQKFNKGADVLLQSSVGVVGHGLDPTIPDKIRMSLKSDMDASVEKPIGAWLSEYKAVKADCKALEKLCGEFGSSEAAVNKANMKRLKAEQSGAAQPKQDKLVAALHAKNATLEAARAAYVSSSPQVQNKCLQLLQSRDELKMKLYCVFAISSERLRQLATLRDSDSFSHGSRAGHGGYAASPHISSSPIPSAGPPGLNAQGHYQSHHVLPDNNAVATESLPPYPSNGFAGDVSFEGYSAFYSQETEEQRPYPKYP